MEIINKLKLAIEAITNQIQNTGYTFILTLLLIGSSVLLFVLASASFILWELDNVAIGGILFCLVLLLFSLYCGNKIAEKNEDDFIS